MCSYNFENSQNLGQGTKANDLVCLFRDKQDIGAQDVDLDHIAAYWKETAEKDKRGLIDQFVAVVAKEFAMDQPES